MPLFKAGSQRICILIIKFDIVPFHRVDLNFIGRACIIRTKAGFRKLTVVFLMIIMLQNNPILMTIPVSYFGNSHSSTYFDPYTII